ncbi:site-specific integrase [Aminipila sp.]|uniref:site-specific integrase n=1 Tax=Aminipila sp. TaxID=2060095 RepID=UPI002896EB41|nr:site-specific integrase [Aminipila sp.]
MKKQESVKRKITASAGYEYVQGKRKQIKRTETVLVPITVANNPKKFNAFIEKEKKRILQELEVERQTERTELTFREYAKKVAERKRSQGDVRGITAESNESILKYLNTFIGDCRMKDINKDVVDMVKGVINNKTTKDGEPISSKTKYNYFSYFRSVINAAMDDNYYISNPISNVRNFKFESAETTYLDQEELLEMMKKLYKYHIKTQIEILIQLFTGTRRGEVLWLRWEDIKEFKGQYFFELKEGFYYTKDEGYYRGKLKTDKSRRKLTIHPLLLKKLQEYKEWQERQKSAYNGDWGNHGYIICSDRGETYNPDYFTKKIGKRFEEMGFDGITTHSLRRSFATLADSEKETTSKVADLLGHSDIVVTNNSYIRKSKRINTVDFLDAIIEESSEPKEKRPRREIRRLKQKIYS